MKYKIFREHVETPESGHSELQFHYCGKEDCKPGHYWGPGIRDHYKIIYVHKGFGILKVMDKTYRLKQGQGYVVFPDTVTYYKADEEQPWTYSWLAFKGSQGEAYFKQAGIDPANPVFEGDGRSLFESFYERMLEARQMNASFDLRFRSILYRVLAELVELGGGIAESEIAGSPKDAYIRKAIEYVEMSYSQKLTIESIADIVGVDRKYLSVLFKEKMNVSPQAYLVQFRMHKACELLQNRELTISEVSRSVGYSDPLLFSKMFKKTIGRSPKTYRELEPASK